MDNKITDNDIALQTVDKISELLLTDRCLCETKPEDVREILRNSKFVIKDLLRYTNSQKAEIDKFKTIETTVNEFWSEIQKLSIAKGKEIPTLEELLEYIEQVKAEAIKEFWELLKVKGKERVDYYTPNGCDFYFSNGTLCGYVAMKEAGDNLVKEMVAKND